MIILQKGFRGHLHAAVVHIYTAAAVIVEHPESYEMIRPIGHAACDHRMCVGRDFQRPDTAVGKFLPDLLLLCWCTSQKDFHAVTVDLCRQVQTRKCICHSLGNIVDVWPDALDLIKVERKVA